jgi:hypothetical protein
LARYKPGGEFVWTSQFGLGGGGMTLYAFERDAFNNFYVCGSFWGSPGVVPSVTLTSNGSDDIFICKFNPNGNFAWAKSIGGSSGDIARDIAIDSIGNIILTGSFSGTVDFDPGAGVATMTSPGTVDVFVAKYDSAGQYISSIFAGQTGASSDQGQALLIDGANNYYVCGQYFNTVDFDPGPATVNLTSAGGPDMFMMKLNPALQLIWAKSIGSTGSEYISSMQLGASGNLVLSGEFIPTTDLDPSAGVFTLTSAGGSTDIFIGQYDSSLTILSGFALERVRKV